MRIALLCVAAALLSAQSKPIVIKAAGMFDGVSDRIVMKEGTAFKKREKIRSLTK